MREKMMTEKKRVVAIEESVLGLVYDLLRVTIFFQGRERMKKLMPYWLKVVI